MVVAGRRKSIAFFISLGVGLISVIILLYVGWVLFNWRQGILLFLGALLLSMIIAGIVVNTTFLVREIRRNEQHDAFINAVTHELKTPVASIRLYLETLKTREVDAQQRQEFYDIMLADTDRLSKTVEQVLRAGRMRHRGRRIAKSAINVTEMVRECLELARVRYGLNETHLMYTESPEASNARVSGDLEELRAAFTNLLDNAVKYSDDEVRVVVSVSASDDKRVIVRVADQGIGIPQTQLRRIFKRFYRVPGRFMARVKGTGLGLFIVKSVVKKHGGRVYAESAGLGHGSTFTVQLPRV